MAFQTGDMTELLSELTCTKCHKLLSVFPIYSSLDGSILCGRCEKNMTNFNSIRNTVYEAVAKHLLFPCANKVYGCTRNLLKHDEVESHEKVCKYRVQECPFNVNTAYCASQCESTVAMTDLPTHLRRYHSSMMLSNPHIFTFTKDDTSGKVNFMELDPETVFIVFSTYDKGTNIFYCIIMCRSDEPVHNKYDYKLELGNGDEYFLNLPINQTEQLQESAELLRNCNRMITVDIASVAKLFGKLDCNLQGRISINKKNDCKPIHKELELNNLILEEFECPVCNNYMRPPIFSCSKGHSLCHECKSKILNCPTCRVPMGNTRNFALEKLALNKKLSYPCKYSDYGCTEVLPVPDIDEHEVQCNSFCPIIPILANGCNLRGDLLERVDHINTYHANILLQQNHYYELILRKGISYRVTICNNEIFIMCCSESLNLIKYNFLHLGMKHNQPQYQYRLTFYNRTEKGMTFTINQLCQVVPLDISDSLNNCLQIPFNMLKPYTFIEESDKKAGFKFNIEKI